MPRATYLGSQYTKWSVDGQEGEFTEAYFVKDFLQHEKDHVGQRAVVEKVRWDMREILKNFQPGQPVNIVYDSDKKGKSVLVGIEDV